MAGWTSSRSAECWMGCLPPSSTTYGSLTRRLRSSGRPRKAIGGIGRSGPWLRSTRSASSRSPSRRPTARVPFSRLPGISPTTSGRMSGQTHGRLALPTGTILSSLRCGAAPRPGCACTTRALVGRSVPWMEHSAGDPSREVPLRVGRRSPLSGRYRPERLIPVTSHCVTTADGLNWLPTKGRPDEGGPGADLCRPPCVDQRCRTARTESRTRRHDSRALERNYGDD